MGLKRKAIDLYKRLVRALVLILIGIDQLLNVLSNPLSDETWADETLSSRCGRLGHRNPYKFWARIIDAIFQPFQGPNHCRNAFEKEKTGYHMPPALRHGAPDEPKEN
jgi:hypothetical protein